MASYITKTAKRSRRVLRSSKRKNGKSHKLRKTRRVIKGGTNPQVENVVFEFDDGSIYEGGILNGKMHGYGKIVWDNGDSYEGDFKENKRHGKGKMVFLDAAGNIDEVYEGDFNDDISHGKGTYTWGTGKVYTGDFKNGKAEGHGKYTWPDGRSYEGKISNNQIDYNDKDALWVWPDGKSYRGALPDVLGEEDLENLSGNDTEDERVVALRDDDRDDE